MAARGSGADHVRGPPIHGDVCAFWFSAAELGSASHGYTPERRPAPGARIVDLALFYERNNLLLNPDFGWVPGSVFATRPVLSANLVTMWAALRALGALLGERPERLFRDAR